MLTNEIVNEVSLSGRQADSIFRSEGWRLLSLIVMIIGPIFLAEAAATEACYFVKYAVWPGSHDETIALQGIDGWLRREANYPAATAATAHARSQPEVVQWDNGQGRSVRRLRSVRAKIVQQVKAAESTVEEPREPRSPSSLQEPLRLSGIFYSEDSRHAVFESPDGKVIEATDGDVVLGSVVHKIAPHQVTLNSGKTATVIEVSGLTPTLESLDPGGVSTGRTSESLVSSERQQIANQILLLHMNAKKTGHTMVRLASRHIPAAGMGAVDRWNAGAAVNQASDLSISSINAGMH